LLRRGLIVSAVGCALAFGSAGVAAAGDPTSFKVAKHTDGPYKEAVRLNVEVGQTRAAFLKVRGVSGVENVELQEHNAVIGYKTKYFKGGENITEAVTSDGFEFVAKPDKAKRFRVTAKRTAGGSDQDCLFPRLNEAELIQFVDIGFNVNPGLCASPV
jgi:hypothetical protein